MNNTRRKQIEDKISSLQIIYDELECLKDEEEEYYDNIPDNLRESERATSSEEIISNFEDALETLSSAIEELENIEG